jgi:fatty acid desaturase
MAGSPGERVTAGDVLTLEELALFRRTSHLRGGLLIAHAWLTIAAAAALYVLWPSPLTLAAAVVTIGARQLGLRVLMHETAHWLLFPGARLNTWVGTWLCAVPLGEDLRQYRRRHHMHHRHTQQPEDPDLMLSARWPVARRRLALALLGDLCGWSRPADLTEAWRRARAPLAANAVMLGIGAAVGGCSLYLLLWVLPWATWYHFATRVRDIAEHGMVEDAADPLRHARTIAAGWLARATLAPYWVNYHLEHHLMVFVPCWRLPRIHALLLARDLGGRMERARSYAEVLSRAGG